MRQNGARTMMLVVLLILIAAACGGSDDGGELPVVSRDDTATRFGGLGLLFNPDHPAVVQASEAAAMLVGQLGDDDTAVGAVLLAGGAGYDGIQIEGAIARGILGADGSIEGVQPAQQRFDLIDSIDSYGNDAAEQAALDDIWPRGAEATAFILALELSGYSPDQIVDILVLGAEPVDADYDGPLDAGYQECPSFVIGDIQQSARFCDPETGELFGGS